MEVNTFFFYWIDPVLSAERTAAHIKYNGHTYYQFELEEARGRPGVRAFGRVNGGVVVEACFFLDTGSVPLPSILYSDKLFVKGWLHHPIYRKYHQNFAYFAYFIYSAYYVLLNYCFLAESLLNIHEDMRAKPSSWSVI